MGVDVVGESEDVVDESVVVLHCHLDLGVLARALHVGDPFLDGLLGGVHEQDEVYDAAVVLVDVLPGLLGPTVIEADLETRVEVGDLSQPLADSLVLEVQLLKDLVVGPELYGGARLTGGLDPLQLAGRLAARVVLGVPASVVAYLDVQPLGQGVDHREADPVEPAGHLVPAAAELPAGVQHREYHFDRGLLEARHLPDRDAPAVVHDGDRGVRLECHGDVRAVARHRLVDAVVDYLVDQVVQAARAGRSDVHAGPLSHRFQPVQDGDAFRVVGFFQVFFFQAISTSLKQSN